ncbi:MAG TPA: hypothetical protein EYQ50_10725, partial [Verrucomicrobiales bacterium]|nr:hypothetical protein [Verrucomicrobiales bacterium]
RSETRVDSEWHTDFKLKRQGEYLALIPLDSPETPIQEFAPEYPPQRLDVSYGMDAGGQVGYFQNPTPRKPNGEISGIRIPPPIEFNLDGGIYSEPIQLILSHPDSETLIRYTLDGNEPSESQGQTYLEPIEINRASIVRAIALAPGQLRSDVKTHSYLVGLAEDLLKLPIMSVVTDSSNLTGEFGIEGISGGTYANGGWQAIQEQDYHNPTKRGPEWERPVSVEYYDPTTEQTFRLNAGIRVQGSNWRRAHYHPRDKYSFRLYFRDDYGESRLESPLFGDSEVDSFKRLTLRSGHNDQVNPFIKDEMVRQMFIDMGHVGARGSFVNLFLNGEFQGYYNITERIDQHFGQSWYGGDNDWEVVKQASSVTNGSGNEWWHMIGWITRNDMTVSINYDYASVVLDLENFVDYLLVNSYAATGDWPSNNWRALRENSPEGTYRFFVWDAEGAFGAFGNNITSNIFTDEMEWDVAISRLYQGLMVSPEFHLLFADRIRKHFFGQGSLTDGRILEHFSALKEVMETQIPNFNTQIERSWIPGRRPILLNQFRDQNFGAFDQAPDLDPSPGSIPPGSTVTLKFGENRIFYTLNGKDPRVMFTGMTSDFAIEYDPGRPIILTQDTLIKTRSMSPEGHWSAVTEGNYLMQDLSFPLRITEIMYHPENGKAFEFLEFVNLSQQPLNLSGMSIEGVKFTFPAEAVIDSGEVILIGSDEDQNLLREAYPDVFFTGFFQGSLSNSGETLRMVDSQGNVRMEFSYDDVPPWPSLADTGGSSLEIIHPELNPDEPGNWVAIAGSKGSPGEWVDRSEEDLFPPDPQVPETIEVRLILVESGDNSPVIRFQRKRGFRFQLQSRSGVLDPVWETLIWFEESMEIAEFPLTDELLKSFSVQFFRVTAEPVGER